MMIYRREREENEQDEVRVANGGFGSELQTDQTPPKQQHHQVQ